MMKEGRINLHYICETVTPTHLQDKIYPSRRRVKESLIKLLDLKHKRTSITTILNRERLIRCRIILYKN
jgi:hypothetical protein